MDFKDIADIGVFGGSGFYKFLDDIKEIRLETPYGAPSNNIFIGKIGNHNVAFMPRHGSDHSILPHMINYRANVWAMKHIGVKRVISPCASGSLQKHVKPGDFVICDQYVNFTQGRKDTFFDGPIVTHTSAALPYCENLRQYAIEACKKSGVNYHEKGTVVVINGPRFSTTAESKFFSNQGWDVINMSQYPEVHLVKEMDMCPLTIALITDYDCGLAGECPPVSHSEVIKVFNSNIENLKKMLFYLIESLPPETDCECKNTLASSRL